MKPDVDYHPPLSVETRREHARQIREMILAIIGGIAFAMLLYTALYTVERIDQWAQEQEQASDAPRVAGREI